MLIDEESLSLLHNLGPIQELARKWLDYTLTENIFHTISYFDFPLHQHTPYSLQHTLNHSHNHTVLSNTRRGIVTPGTKTTHLLSSAIRSSLIRSFFISQSSF